MELVTLQTWKDSPYSHFIPLIISVTVELDSISANFGQQAWYTLDWAPNKVHISSLSQFLSLSLKIHREIAIETDRQLSPILPTTIMDNISSRSQDVEGVWFYGLCIAPLFFFSSFSPSDDAVLLVSSCRDLQLLLEWFAAEGGAVGMKISSSKSETMILSWKRVKLGNAPPDQRWDPAPSRGLQVSCSRVRGGWRRTSTGGWIGAAFAVMQIWYWSVVVKEEMCWKVKLSIHQSI